MGDRQEPRQIDAPEPGRFKCRIVKSGPWIHARIWSVMGMLQAEIGGVSCAVSDVWETGTRITDAEYFRLRDHPAERPGEKVNIRTVETF
jgi:hypothetical protein